MRQAPMVAACLALGAWQLAAGSWQPALRWGRASVPAFAATAGGQSVRPTRDAALMPPDSPVSGWKKSDNGRVFTKADLYGYIDGGAELFLEFGFEQLALQKYRGGPNAMAVEIYRMVDPLAALGVYLMKCGRETPDPSFRDRHTLNRHQLLFVRGRHYVAINNLSGAEGLGGALVDFGRSVASGLPADKPVLPVTLPADGQVPGSLRLVRGQFGLQSIYTLGEGDILQLGGRLTAASANYKDAAGPYTLLAVAYPTSAAAKSAFANVQRNLDKYLKPTASGPSRLVFKDYENKFGLVSLGGTRLEVRLHLARDPR